MKVTKYAHSCLLIEVGGIRIITDPGTWNKTPDATNIDAILVTHEHQDHCDVGQIKSLITRNPGVRVITHTAVGKILEGQGVTHELLGHKNILSVGTVEIQSIGTEHAIIYEASPCRNTGYLINKELFITGDALHDLPDQSVRVLALPTGGPWMRLSESIDYAKKLRPQIVFPVHDAMYTEDYRSGLIPRIIGGYLESEGITFLDLCPGTSQEI